MASQTEVKQRLVECLRELHLPTFRDGFEELARRAVQESLSYEQYLGELAEQVPGSADESDRALAPAIGLAHRQEPDLLRHEAVAGEGGSAGAHVVGRRVRRRSRERSRFRAIREAGKLTCYARLRRNWCARAARYFSVPAACSCKIC